jgi:predicted nucleic acid-binding protein
VKLALDTNILAHAEGVNGASMKGVALGLLEKLPVATVVLPVQTLGELFNLLVRKAKWPPATARSAMLNWQDTFPLIDTSAEVMLGATDLATDHQFVIWDAVVLSAAAEAGCRLLLSEDLHEGFTWRGVTITNPFAARKHEILARLLESEPEL